MAFSDVSESTRAGKRIVAQLKNALRPLASTLPQLSGLPSWPRTMGVLKRHGFSPATVFAFLVNSYGAVAIFVYVFIATSELRLRRTLEREDPERLRVRMWAYPYLTYFAIASMILIVAAMAFIPAQQKPLLFGVISLLALLLAYVPRYFLGRKETPAAVLADGKEP